MHVVEWLEELGGVATRSTLVRLTSRPRVDRALTAGDIVADARGRYALPSANEAVRAAHRLSGVLSHESAALHHGWEVKSVPALPHVTVPKSRKIAPARVSAVHLHRADLHPDDVSGIATSPALTIEQCLRSMPFDAALAVADSALRDGLPTATLRHIAAAARGPGSAQVRRVAREARAEAANPFESVLRAIALDVGLAVRPQLVISASSGTVRPDLVDEDLRIVLEADSFEWHGKRASLRKDCRRYNLLVVDGWLVLRFAWEDVMHDQDYVRAVLVAISNLVLGRTQRRTSSTVAA
ncbi:MAG: DUF559 domain-containing protein [Marmoricola sp.]